jgi:4-hydroxy-4-methyl-2-oxoglutarate aldolase
MDAGLRRLSGERLIGPAYPVWTCAGDSSTIHRALWRAPVEAVLVVDAEGHLGRAVWGHVLTVAAQRRGLAGVVIDGAIRDLDAIRSTGFPVYARGVCPAGPHKGFAGRYGATIQCGGVSVAPESLVVGDADGVVVVPVSQTEQIMSRTLRTLEREADWLRRIDAGETTLELLGLSED